MVDTKLSDLTEDTLPTSDDIMLTTDNNTIVSRKVTLANLFDKVGIVEDTTPQLGGDLDLNGNNLDFPTTVNISDCLDEDNMVSNSATALATQQSIKAYVDSQAGGGDTLPVVDTTGIAKGSVDATKIVRFEVDGLTTATTRILTMADADIDLTPGTGSFIKDIVSDTTPTLGGDLDAGDNNITNLAVAGFNVTDDGNSGAADTIDWTSGNFHKSTLTSATVTFTYTDPFTGSTDVGRLEHKIVQDATGGRDVVMPVKVVWPEGEPIWTDGTSNQTIRITLIYDDDDDEYVGQATSWY